MDQENDPLQISHKILSWWRCARLAQHGLIVARLLLCGGGQLSLGAHLCRLLVGKRRKLGRILGLRGKRRRRRIEIAPSEEDHEKNGISELVWSCRSLAYFDDSGMTIFLKADMMHMVFVVENDTWRGRGSSSGHLVMMSKCNHRTRKRKWLRTHDESEWSLNVLK